MMSTKTIGAAALGLILAVTATSANAVPNSLPSSSYLSYQLPTPPQIAGAGNDGPTSLGLGINSSLNFGSVSCNGMNLPNMFSSFKNNLQQTVQYYYSNALTIAFNYLVYSSPSLYQILQDTNRKFTKYEQFGLKTCQDIQLRAKRSNPLYKRAMAMCLTDQHSTSWCSNDSNLSSYVDKAAAQDAQTNQEVDRSLPHAQQAAAASSSGGPTSVGAGGSTDYGRLILGDYPLTPQTAALFNAVVGNVKSVPNPKTGHPPMQVQPRTIKLGAVVKCRAQFYASALNMAVQAYVAKDRTSLVNALDYLNPPATFQDSTGSVGTTASSGNASSPLQGQCSPTTAKDFSQADNAGDVPITEAMIYQLALTRARSPADYDTAVSAIAQNRGLAYGDYLVGQFGSAVLNAESSGVSATYFNKYDGQPREIYSSSLAFLKHDMDVLHRLHDDADRQQSIITELIKFNRSQEEQRSSNQPTVQ